MSLFRIFISIIIFFILISFSSFSQTAYLCLKLNDGSTVQYSIGDINKITFDNVTNVGDSKKLEKVLKSFQLLQNYPNPFNPTTSIHYQIPKQGTVDIKIFNIAGKLVKTISKKHSKQGNYSSVWDATNNNGNSVSSGLYIYQARFEESIISKRMIFLK
jgi:flagellar hook capping protein FlgD